MTIDSLRMRSEVASYQPPIVETSSFSIRNGKVTRYPKITQATAFEPSNFSIRNGTVIRQNSAPVKVKRTFEQTMLGTPRKMTKQEVLSRLALANERIYRFSPEKKRKVDIATPLQK